MNILPGRAAPIKPARPHNPDVCGLDFESDCDACRASAEDAERALLERDAEARERERLRVIGKRFIDATGIPLADLAAALLPLMARGMAEVASAVIDERGAA